MKKLIIYGVILLITFTNIDAENIDKKSNFDKDELGTLEKAEIIKQRAIAKAKAKETKVIAKAIKDRTIAEIEAIKINDIAHIEAKALTEIKMLETRIEASKVKIAEEAEKAKIKAELLYRETIKKVKKRSDFSIEIEKIAIEEVENNISSDVNDNKMIDDNKSIKNEREEEIKSSGVEEDISKLLKARNIEFKRAKSILTPGGAESVAKLAGILAKYPSVYIEIAGYTDSDGSTKHNLALSQSRVNSVKKILVAKGIDEKRLVAKGYGEANPLVPNKSKKNKQKNRRVEIHIIRE